MATLISALILARLCNHVRLRRGRAVWLSGVLLAFCMSAGAAVDEAPQVSEQRIKAAFLYKFASYVDWPPASFPQTDSPFVIGVADAEGVAADLAQLIAGRTIKGRAITVRRIRPGDTLAGVHMLFIGSERMQELLFLARGQPILTVTDDNGRSGGPLGILHFVLDGNRVRFEASPVSAERNGLRLSAQLLAVARQVHGGP